MNAETNEAIATAIVDKIIRDLSDRQGLSDEWDMIHEDLQHEIRRTWRGIVLSALNQ